MPVPPVEATRAQAHRATAPSLPWLGTPVWPVRGAIPPHGGTAGAHRLLAGGAHCVARPWSGSGGPTPVVLGLLGPRLGRVACAWAWPTGARPAGRDEPPPRRGS